MTASYVLEWLNLLGRGLHVVAGIAWIGASFYFIWLDDHLQDPRGREAPAESNDAVARGVAGELWAVHGGGFYHSQKYRVSPPAMPATLHWFKWEAYTTLLSGLFLLGVVYYAQPELYMVDASVSNWTPSMAVLLGAGWIVGGWIAYDALCRSPLGRNDRALAAVLALFCGVAAYALCHTLSGRAAFLHFGAMLGTIMVLNVFFVIIPGQREMVRAAAEGRAVDPIHGLRGKQRSVHNTYFTLPAVFTMISPHYAWIFGGRWNWVWLLAISAAGVLIRQYFVVRHRGSASPWYLIAAAVLLALTAYGARPRTAATAAVTDARAQAIVSERCTGCHSASPRLMPAAPKGVALDTAAEVRRHAVLTRAQVLARAMPPGNLTGMTDAERSELIAWIDAGGTRGR